MNNEQTQVQQPGSIGVDDFIYLFFRHKWKIIFCTLVGCAAAVWIYTGERTDYRVQAKLLVRYITEKKNPLTEGGPGDKDTVRSLDPRDGANMLAEIEILRSIDCIQNAINTVTPQKVLKAYEGSGTNLYDAVELVLRSLVVEPTRNSGLMIVTLSHRDQDIAQRLLREIINQYQDLHQKAHKPSVTYQQVMAERDRVKGQLDDVEKDLRNQKRKVNIWSLDQSKADLTTQLTAVKTDISKTEADLAEVRALVDDRKPGSETNTVAEASAKPERPAPADIAHFNEVARRLTKLRSSESELSGTFSDSSKTLKKIRDDIKEAEEELKGIPVDPAFLAQVEANHGSAAAPGGVINWESARLKIIELEARYSNLTNKFALLNAQAARLDAAEDTIVDLENQKKKLDDQYAYLRNQLDQLMQDEKLDPSLGNIKIVQNATRIPPDTKKVMKKAGSAVGAGAGVGFLLALLLDFVFNPSVKRTKDLEVGVRVPVIASIPDFGCKLKANGHANGAALQRTGANGHINGTIAPWEEDDPMLPYYEALRDRVVMSYNGDLHKPKIVGLTSCNAGAGVSRLATGLAAALSRDAERNILLVGLERNKVAVSAFAKGRPTDGIERPPENSQSDGALVAQNLYSLATTGRNLAGASVVQSFSDLLPKLKISEYDYVIFDLPPLTQTSGSLRLATQMERTILVVEAEETGKTKVKRAVNLIKAAQPKLFTVLNKAHEYGPKSLRTDI